MLSPIMNRGDSFFVRAMGATIEILAGLDPMSDDFAPAMLAFGSQRVDCALEAVKIMGDAVDDDFQRFIVFVSTNFALSHKFSFLAAHSGGSLLRLSSVARFI